MAVCDGELARHLEGLPKMLNGVTICFAALCVAVACQEAKSQVTLARVDVLDRVYPDRPPPDFPDDRPVSVPRGGSAAIQFAATSPVNMSCGMAVGPLQREDGLPLAGRVATYRLLPVHVEGNTQGSLRNRPGGQVPDGWMKYLVRRAPFDVMEVLVEADTVALAAGRTQAMLVDVEVAPEASPGRYAGRLDLRLEQETVSVPFSVLVHRTVLPPTLRLHCVHWFWPMPENLTDGDPPPWWSERHWALIEASARQLHRFGDDTVLTPLVDGREPLIRVSRDEQGAHHFG
jgi:hypothetical protein